MMRSSLLFVGFCLLAACGRPGEPAPFFQGGRAVSDSPSQGSYEGALGGASVEKSRPRTIPAGETQSHRVARGETVYAISRHYNVPIRTVIEANDLRAPYTLRIGQTVIVPAPRRHEVQRGETVYGLSRTYDVAMSELTRANGIAAPYIITPGQVLVIPEESIPQIAARPEEVTPPQADQQTSSESAVRDEAQADEARPPARSQPQVWPRGPREPGGAEHGESSEDLAGEASSSSESPVETAASVPQSQPEPEPQPQSSTAQAETAPEVERVASKPPAEIPQPAARESSQFLWPVRGRTIMSYGRQADGLHSDGINVAAPRGTPIHAAENGVVAYVGSELRGFGNLLLIKHADDWVTAYAHADEILVSLGESVRRGQTVARIGSSGGVDRPQLHFEVRRGARAVDPLSVLETQEARGARGGQDQFAQRP